MSEDKLTNHQTEILKKLKIQLADILTSHHTDNELLKLLKAKNFDLKKAERIFRQGDMYQKMFTGERINGSYVKPDVIREYERTCFLGFSKDGTPARYLNLNVDIYGFVQSISQLDMCLYFINLLEGDKKTMKEPNIRNSQNHDGMIYICNLEGYSFQDLAYKSVIETVLEYIRLYQEYYPENWRYILFINAPYLFYKISYIFKPILKNTFIEKVKIASKSTTLELLREYIDDDLISAILEEKRVNAEEDTDCKELVNPYGKIPEEYYLKNSMHLIDETDPEVKVVVIRAKSCYNVLLVVKEAGSKIRMEFRTAKGTINFVILYRQFGSDTEKPDLPKIDEYLDPDEENSNILSIGGKVKYQSHIAPVDGTGTAVWPGIYILHFDNTSSWFGARKLYYRVTVTSPDN